MIDSSFLHLSQPSNLFLVLSFLFQDYVKKKCGGERKELRSVWFVSHLDGGGLFLAMGVGKAPEWREGEGVGGLGGIGLSTAAEEAFDGLFV